MTLNGCLKLVVLFIVCWLLTGLGCAFVASGLTHDGLTNQEFALAIIEGPIVLLWLMLNLLLSLFGL
jgi:hypothetical protein